MGIEQLVDSFMGNPKPLEAKVERDNKGLPPGAIPRDLEEAIALQKIAEVQTGAQNQQAMQAGGAQPSVVQKLHQMLAMAQQRQQAQMPQGAQQMPGQMPRPMPQGMPQQPVMAAHGGSLDQLASNLARHYAGGGIVAFNGEDDNNPVEDPNAEKRSLIERLLYSNLTPAEQRRRAEIQAAAQLKEAQEPQAPVAQSIALTPQQMEATVKEGAPRQVTQRELAEAYNRKRWAQQAEDAAAPKENLGAMLEKLLYSNITPAEQKRRTDLQAAAEERVRERNKPIDGFSQQSNRALLNAADSALRGQPAGNAQSAVQSPAQTQTRPTVTGLPGGVGAAPAAQTPVDPNSLRALLESSIKKELGKDEEAEWQKGATRHEQFMGLDKLLAPKNARIAEEQALIKKIQGERLPAWVAGAERASKPIVAGGIGTMLNNLGTGMQGQREAYNTEDLGFLDKIGRMQDEVDKLKIEGKYKAAAAGEASIKDAIANKRQAEQSGTSLLNTDEQTATRRQIAKDAALARLEAAKARGEGVGDKQQLAELKALQGAVTSQLKNAYGSERKRLQTQLEAINGEIAKMAGMSTMVAAPGATSPGGTPADINALLKKYGGK